jgi:hypothetical protein
MARLAELGTPFDFHGEVTIRPSEVKTPLTLRVELVLALIIGDAVCPESQHKTFLTGTLLLGSLAAGPLRGAWRVGSLPVEGYLL